MRTIVGVLIGFILGTCVMAVAQWDPNANRWYEKQLDRRMNNQQQIEDHPRPDNLRRNPC